MTVDTILETTWDRVLGPEKQKPYFQDIIKFIKAEKAANKTIYPAQNDIFNAFVHTSFANTKVVILGQDPYHGPGQAHGLCFSVQPGTAFPPSLKNIFKELHTDLNLPIPKTGCLDAWAKQGVLLLNTSLTVEAGRAQSHGKIGWEIFTDQVIRLLSEHHKNLVFLLWGGHAQRKAELIDITKHFILTTTHPSPLSAHRGFLGCGHFSKTNALLVKHQREPINWDLS